MEVRTLSAENAKGAVDVLTHAFAGYPFLERAFTGANRSGIGMRRMMFEWAISYRLATGIPALVAVEGREVLGVATLRTPNDPELPMQFEAGWRAIEAEMNPQGIGLFDAYDRLQGQLMPTPRPWYLVAIGVDRSRQGEGIGRALIDRAREMAGSAGLMLDTHDEANVAKYLALGFQLYAEADLLGMPNWYFACGIE